MPGESTMPHADLPYRPAAQAQSQSQNQSQSQSQSIPIKSRQSDERRHKHSRSSYSDAGSFMNSRNNSLSFRPAKRSMLNPDKTIAIINASGRQAASVIRVATAVGYHVRAQLRNLEGVVAAEVSSNPNVTVLTGELYTRQGAKSERADVTQSGPISGIGVNHQLISELFWGAQLAFINTTFYGDEIQIGEALSDAAKRAGVQHFVFSSMPDHHAYDAGWPSLPLWASKHKIEEYVKEIGLPATFVYTGIYNNNFTSLPYPLFCMELQPDGSFTWQAPFHPDAKLPWLDAEHDVGPAILQVFKEGTAKWGGRRVALAYEILSPREACKLFEKGVGRRVRYIRGKIEVKVKIPEGYRIQLEALETLFNLGKDDPMKQPPYFGDRILDETCPQEAMELWEGFRGLEEYAREVFPLEEQANGKMWMVEDVVQGTSEHQPEEYEEVDGRQQDDQEDEEESDEDDGLVMRANARTDEEWLA